MAKLLTVTFAVPDDEPCASANGMADELQTWYDKEGIGGSFQVTSCEDYVGNPAMHFDRPVTEIYGKYDIRSLANECHPEVAFGGETFSQFCEITSAQKQTLFAKWKQDHNEKTWPEFAASILPFDFGAIGVQWCGIFLGIERDGHAHS